VFFGSAAVLLWWHPFSASNIHTVSLCS